MISLPHSDGISIRITMFCLEKEGQVVVARGCKLKFAPFVLVAEENILVGINKLMVPVLKRKT